MRFNENLRLGEAPFLVEISQNEARVLKILVDSGGKAPIEDLAEQAGLADSAVARAVLNLSQNKLVNEKVEKKTELSLTDEGRTFARVGLPERIILLEVKNHGGRLSLREALQHSKLAEKYGSIATGWISRKKWGTIEKSGPDLVIVARSEAPIDDDEEILARLKSDILILEELPPALKEAAQRLTKRNLVESQPRNDREVEITEAGRNIGTTAPSHPEVSSLSGNMIVSGEWEKVKLRSYNVSSAVPWTFPGKYHPYLRFLRMVKRKLVALGFREAIGPLVDTAFINCDCLYMPQDHPAREIHDLYYLKDPSRASLEKYGGLVDRVAQTHENGWKTGSTGWRYKFSRDEASKLILRSHGTAVSVRTILSKDLQIPGK